MKIFAEVFILFLKQEQAGTGYFADIELWSSLNATRHLEKVVCGKVVALGRHRGWQTHSDWLALGHIIYNVDYLFATYWRYG